MSNNAQNNAYYAAYSTGQQYYYPVIPPPPYGGPPPEPPGQLTESRQLAPSAPPPAPMPPVQAQLVFPKRKQRKKKLGLFDIIAWAMVDEPSSTRPSTRAIATPAYVSLSRNYIPPAAPRAPSYQVGYHYQHPFPQNQLQPAAPSARHAGVVYQPPRDHSPSESSSSSAASTQPRTSSPPPPLPLPPLPQKPRPYKAPVLLCHTCTQCGQPRSRAFHHHYPVIPGEPTILGVCAKCHKKNEKTAMDANVVNRRMIIRQSHRSNSVDRTLRIKITSAGSDDGDRRGRSTSPEEVIVRRVRSLSRDNDCGRSSGRTRVVLRTLSESPRPKTASRTKVSLRKSSESPPRNTYDRTKIVKRTSWESPPPSRAKESRIVRRSERSRRRSPDPPPQILRHQVSHVHPSVRYGDAERRIASHPMPFRHGRAHHPDQRAFLNRSTPSISPPRLLRRPTPPEHSQSQPRSILRSPSRTRYRDGEKPHLGKHRSAESTMVEVGGPRVQFAAEPSKRHSSISENSEEFWRARSRERAMHGGDAHYSRDDVSPRRLQDHGYYQDPKPFHPRNPHSPPDPPYYESRTSNRYTLDIDYASTLSRSPSPSRGRPRQRGYSTPLPSPPPPPPPPPPGWEWNSHPEPRSMPWDDTTESGDSDETRELVDVRGYRGLDENGRPATFIEERRTVTMPDRTREERPAAGGWKDV